MSKRKAVTKEETKPTKKAAKKAGKNAVKEAKIKAKRRTAAELRMDRAKSAAAQREGTTIAGRFVSLAIFDREFRRRQGIAK